MGVRILWRRVALSLELRDARDDEFTTLSRVIEHGQRRNGVSALHRHRDPGCMGRVEVRHPRAQGAHELVGDDLVAVEVSRGCALRERHVAVAMGLDPLVERSVVEREELPGELEKRELRGGLDAGAAQRGRPEGPLGRVMRRVVLRDHAVDLAEQGRVSGVSLRGEGREEAGEGDVALTRVLLAVDATVARGEGSEVGELREVPEAHRGERDRAREVLELAKGERQVPSRVAAKRVGRFEGPPEQMEPDTVWPPLFEEHHVGAVGKRDEGHLLPARGRSEVV